MFKIYPLLCLPFCILPAYSSSYLLQSPPSYIEETTDVARGLDMDFSKEGPDKDYELHLRFRYFHDQTYLLVQIYGNLPNVSPEIAEKLQYSKQNGKDVWSFVYPNPPSELYPDLIKTGGTLEESMGMMAERLSVDDSSPIRMSVDELSNLLDGKQVIFYTGAGISASAVPTMDKLIEDLDIVKETSDEFLMTLQSAIQDPSPRHHVMDDFNQACFNAQPTSAHWALKDITTEKNWGLMTENLDQLHQKTGVEPLNHSKQDWLEANISEEDLRNIQYVITVGLHSDESGFLKWYKNHNPEGKIVAFNIVQPVYLSDEDILVEGDVQRTLPELREQVLQKPHVE